MAIDITVSSSKNVVDINVTNNPAIQNSQGNALNSIDVNLKPNNLINADTIERGPFSSRNWRIW